MWRRGGDWEGVWSLEWDWLEEENEGVLQGTGVASFNERANQKFREKTNNTVLITSIWQSCLLRR